MKTQRVKHIVLSGILLCALPQGTRAHPNNLEPIPAYDPVGYDQAVFTSLIGKRAPALWMIEKHSFANEYAVILRHEIEYDPNYALSIGIPRTKRDRWIVEHVVARERIWKWKSTKDGRQTLDIRPTDNVERRHTVVTLNFAWTVQEAWRSVLKLTRYSGNYWGVDGTTLQFYCEPRYFGEIWSPETGLPAMLVALGHKLTLIAQSDETSKEALLAEAADLARKITEEAEAERKRVFGGAPVVP